jgi:topoisomerase-4 subunit A
MFPISELTLLPKGKGLKIIQIPPTKFKTREEYVIAMTAMGETDKLVVYSGKKHVTLKSRDQEYYIGERGRRGNMLTRGYRNVIRIKAEP